MTNTSYISHRMYKTGLPRLQGAHMGLDLHHSAFVYSYDDKRSI